MTCFGIDGAYNHREVNIGWFRYVVTSETSIRTIPGGGNHIATLARGQGLGAQSKRNPDAQRHIDQRPAAHAPDGRPFLWCYARKDGNTGWVAADDIAPDHDVHEPLLKGPMGPRHGHDFEVGHGTPNANKTNTGCGHDLRDRPRGERLRVVHANEVYLRYSPKGTAYQYLHAGDRVLLLIAANPDDFAFVEVLESSHGNPADPATRGWIIADSLKHVGG